MRKILIAALLGLAGCAGNKPVQCTAISHNVTYDKYGSIYYNTLLDCCGDRVRNTRKAKYYIIPVGAKITYIK